MSKAWAVSTDIYFPNKFIFQPRANHLISQTGMRTIPSNALSSRNYFPRIWPQINSIPERNAEQTENSSADLSSLLPFKTSHAHRFPFIASG
ncbi:hypothetical protein TNIN_275241 [Trichonephila inaurata madagascariensis]|uniref:Uncharacterized protein n=1 Tax=Trichonephila inaurata madagascariensis TaxID=2747483 RepID=A0A8X6YEA5_9ARAC|nr:hypothetical protein TNIN_275241 [Trichonephila inaurata madagascariensis]